jgi:hypothetical protein
MNHHLHIAVVFALSTFGAACAEGPGVRAETAPSRAVAGAPIRATHSVSANIALFDQALAGPLDTARYAWKIGGERTCKDCTLYFRDAARAPDGSVWVVGAAIMTPSLGGRLLKAKRNPQRDEAILAHISKDGTLLESARFAGDDGRFERIHVAQDGSLTVTGSFETEIELGRTTVRKAVTAKDTSEYGEPVGAARSNFLARFSPAGTPLWATAIARGERARVSALWPGSRSGEFCILGRAVVSDASPWVGVAYQTYNGAIPNNVKDLVLSHHTVAQCFLADGVLSRETDLGAFEVQAAQERTDGHIVLVARKREPLSKETVTFVTSISPTLLVSPAIEIDRAPPWVTEVTPPGSPSVFQLNPGRAFTSDRWLTSNERGSFIGIAESEHARAADLVHVWPNGTVTRRALLRLNEATLAELDCVQTHHDGSVIIGIKETKYFSTRLNVAPMSTPRAIITLGNDDALERTGVMVEPSVNAGWFPRAKDSIRLGDYGVLAQMTTQ